MASAKCKKCNTELSTRYDRCLNCGEKLSLSKRIMAWVFIILLLVFGMVWAFTDSEPDVTVDPTPNLQ